MYFARKIGRVLTRGVKREKAGGVTAGEITLVRRMGKRSCEERVCCVILARAFYTLFSAATLFVVFYFFSKTLQVHWGGRKSWGTKMLFLRTYGAGRQL